MSSSYYKVVFRLDSLGLWSSPTSLRANVGIQYHPRMINYAPHGPISAFLTQSQAIESAQQLRQQGPALVEVWRVSAKHDDKYLWLDAVVAEPYLSQETCKSFWQKALVHMTSPQASRRFTEAGIKAGKLQAVPVGTIFCKWIKLEERIVIS